MLCQEKLDESLDLTVASESELAGPNSLVMVERVLVAWNALWKGLPPKDALWTKEGRGKDLWGSGDELGDGEL